MTGEHVERRLAAVLAADVAGYSRLMGEDEEGTLSRLKAIRKALVDPTVAAHRGRIVKSTGDGILVEFASAVDAARCAVEIQRLMAAQNADVPQGSRIEFRIGIHVGDIIFDEGDIFGDGVNIAARLEGIADPGGVCLSDDAQRQVRGKVQFDFDDMGSRLLKNIAQPMRAWRAQLDDNVTLTQSMKAPSDLVQPLALPDKPSIAVLPFQNMSGDPEQEYFADGMVEDIITGLSRSKSLFVIARNSSFTYKGKAVDIKQVGRELGVHYILEGSVRKAANRVRITGQLIDAASDRHIWADKFDGELDDIFELQDRVTSHVIGAITPQLERAEISRAHRKPTESLRAYDYYLRAMSQNHRFNREANVEMLTLAKMACELDPEFSAAYALAALTFVQRKAFAWRNDIAQEKFEARRLARRAIELDKDDPSVLAMAGHTLCYVLEEVEEGAALLSRAIDLDPNLASARYWSGGAHAYLGELDAAIEQFAIALRLSPLDPRIFLAQSGTALAHFLAGRYEEGASWATMALQNQPNFVNALRTVMACHAMCGRVEKAKHFLEMARQLDPTQCISGIRMTAPFRRAEDIEKLAKAYRIAGMPE